MRRLTRQGATGSGSFLRGLGTVNEIDLDLHHGLVWTEVKKHRHRTANVYIDVDDLVQIGYLGLIEAAQRFDHSRGFKFSTYAVNYIWGYIMRALRDAQWAPAHLLDEASKAGTWDELRTIRPASTVAQRELEDASARKYAVDVDGAFVEHQPEFEALRGELFAGLDAREREIAQLRWIEGQTLESIGQRIGVTRERVRQLENRARERILRRPRVARLNGGAP